MNGWSRLDVHYGPWPDRTARHALSVAVLMVYMGSRTASAIMSVPSGWITAGSAVVADSLVELNDNSGVLGAAWQVFELPTGSHTVSFDVQSGLSDTYASGTFPDAVFASLFFVDAWEDFDPTEGGSAASQALFDYDHLGAYNLNGTLAPTVGRDGWWTYQGSFDLSTPYVVVAFELDSLNQELGDSLFKIDNVAVAVPEPGIGSLLAAGLIGLCLRRRARQS